MPLFSVFIDLTKAFDTVNSKALWTVLEPIGCPQKFVKMIQFFDDGMTSQVLSSGDTETFEISNGVKQGCVLAPVFFNVFFMHMLSHADRDVKKGVYIQYRLDGSLFDVRRLSAKTKCSEDLLQEAPFANDCALVAHDRADLQRTLYSFSEASKLFGLTKSIGKTKVLHQPAPHTNHPGQSMFIDGTHSSQTLRASNTREEPYPMTALWTKRLQLTSAKQAWHWEDSATEDITSTIFA